MRDTLHGVLAVTVSCGMAQGGSPITVPTAAAGPHALCSWTPGTAPVPSQGSTHPSLQATPKIPEKEGDSHIFPRRSLASSCSLLSLGCLCQRCQIPGRGEQARVPPQVSLEALSLSHSLTSQSWFLKSKCSLQS